MKLNLLFKLWYLNSNFTLTLGSLNTALNNPALMARLWLLVCHSVVNKTHFLLSPLEYSLETNSSILRTGLRSTWDMGWNNALSLCNFSNEPELFKKFKSKVWLLRSKILTSFLVVSYLCFILVNLSWFTNDFEK